MDAKELMIGNLVQIGKDCWFDKGTIVVIHGIDADREFQELKGCATCVAFDDPNYVRSGVWLEYLEPIPLADEILLKNGFKYHPSERGMYGVPISPHYEREGCPKVWCDGDPFAVWFEEEVPIRYVHELQNILFICRQDSDIRL